MRVIWNGQILNEQEIHLNLNENRAFAFGDGFFETIRLHENKVPLLKFHWKRINKAAAALRLNLPFEFDDLQNYIYSLANENLMSNGRIKLTVFRHSTGAYLSNNWETSRFSLTLNPFNPVPEKVFENSGILSTRLFSKNSFSAFKTLNALPYIELSREANQNKWETGIALNEFDEAVDACWHSFGIFQENEIILPEYSRGGIWSCGAMALEEYLSQINTSFQRKCIKALELETCQEIFFINALDGIVPLRIWNNSKKSIELSKKLAQGFNTFYYF